MAAERRAVKIETVEYRSSSKNGNPRFRVNTDKGSWLTAPDASVANSIQNEEYHGDVILVIDGDDVVGISTIDGAHFSGRQE